MIGQVEIREAADGPHLHGVLIQEGRAARRRREVFAPGAVEWPSNGVGILTRHHGAPEARAIPERQPDGRITLRARATDAIRDAVESGRRFMSVEFHALRERRTEGGIREILRALVPDVALVPDPEYGQTAAEVRRRIGSVSAGFPTGKALDCRCGPAECTTATIDISGLEIPEGTPAFLGDFRQPLGAALHRIDAAGRVTVEADILGTTWGRDLIEAGERALIVRPYPDPARSTWEKRAADRLYTSLWVAAWIFTWTDQTGGFEGASVSTRAENRRGTGRVERFNVVRIDSGAFWRKAADMALTLDEAALSRVKGALPGGEPEPTGASS